MIALTLFLVVAPRAAGAASAPEAGLRVMSLKQIGPDGKETVEQQTLGPGEMLVVHRLNGQIVSRQTLPADGTARVIIRLKDPPVAQSFRRAMHSAAAGAARRQLDATRAGFRARLLDLDNFHRSKKGLAARSGHAFVTREYRDCFNGLAARVQPETAAALRQMPEVAAVYVDREFKKLDGSYGVAQIGAPQVWQNLGVTGQGETIAIVDTGIDYLHPDLGDGFGPGHKVSDGYDFVNADADPMDDNGHGTHVAGIAAANGQIKGVAPDARLLAVKVLDTYGFGLESNIIAGIEWAVDHGADIVNLSLGDNSGVGNPDDPLCLAVDAATEAGVLVVCAAGNTGGYNTVSSPAAARTALAVGADDGNRQVAYFSSRGPVSLTYQAKPEVIAPGVGIVSTVPSGGTPLSNPSGYLALDGTSMASPHVAGAAALLLQEHPAWTPEQLRLALIEGALDLQQDVMTQGGGEVDVYASATSPILSTGGELSLGWDDLSQNVFSSVQPLTVTNTGTTAVQLTTGTVFTPPPGMQVSVSPGSVSLAPGESTTVNFNVFIDNTVTPNLPAQPFTYGGMMTMTTDTGASIHRPFSICKAPKLVVSSDAMLQAMLVFQGSQLSRNQPLLSSGPFETLLPAGTYDFDFPFVVSGSSGLESRNVVREHVDVSNVTSLFIAEADAINRLELQPIDRQGAPLDADWNDIVFNLRHVPSNTWITIEIGGAPIAQLNHQWISDASSTFSWDASLAGWSNAPADPIYYFNASLRHGIAKSKTFAFQPADFNHTVIRHAARPDLQPELLRNWMWMLYPGSGYAASGYASDVPFTAPLDQDVYATVPATDDTPGGRWSIDEFGLDYTGTLPFWTQPATTRTAVFRPLSKQVLGRYDPFLLALIDRTAAHRLLAGEGPAYWSGSFGNLSNVIRIRTASPNQVDQKLFNGQTNDELVHGLLAYTLSQHGQPVASGTLDGAMDFAFWPPKSYVAELPVAPGVYDLEIPFHEFYLQGAPGQLTVRNHFDTTKSDPNPPFLTGYQLLNPLDLLRRNPFLDAIPVTGAELRFGADDDVQVHDATLSIQQGHGWRALPLVRIDAHRYAAYLPWLGFQHDSATLKLVVTDTSGNAVTLTETLPYVKR